MTAFALDLHWLTEQLAVGGRFPAAAAAALAAEHHIGNVVDLREEDRDEEVELRRHGILLLHLPTTDRCALSRRALRDGVTWVSAALDLGQRVLIHCEHGIGRSALLAMAVLVSRGRPPLAAMEIAKSARNVVSPSPEQLQAFIDYAADLKVTSGADWEVPTLDQLGRIAYRHLSRAVEGEGSGDGVFGARGEKAGGGDPSTR
jgi:protein-tyrosine phosphatase